MLLLPCCTCIFWGINLLLNVRNNSRAQNILMILTVLVGLFFYIQADYFATPSDYLVFHRLEIVDGYISMLIPPFTYLYFKSLTNNNPFSWKDYLLFLPSLMVGMGSHLLYWAMGLDNALLYAQAYVEQRDRLLEIFPDRLYRLHYFVGIQLYNLVAFLQMVLVVIYANYKVIKYHRELGDFYSNLDDKSVRYSSAVLFWASVSMLLPLVFIVTKRTFWVEHPHYNMVLLTLWTTPYFIWFYFANKLQFTVEEFSHDLQEADAEQHEAELVTNARQMQLSLFDAMKESNGEMTEADYNLMELREQLDLLMKTKQLFLQNTLRIDDVANVLRTNRTYLSQLIKELFGCNFSDYVNQLRVEYAQKLLAQTQGEDLNQIAIESGFSSLSSFYRVFKKYVHRSPKEWVAKH